MQMFQQSQNSKDTWVVTVAQVNVRPCPEICASQFILNLCRPSDISSNMMKLNRNAILYPVQPFWHRSCNIQMHKNVQEAYYVSDKYNDVR